MSGISDVILPEEINLYVQSLREFHIDELGSKCWLEHHERVVKLGQQAILEASQNREETVKELMIIEGKLELLVHSALTVSIWRHKILSKLLEETPNLKVTILIYTVLYHEVVSISFLETLLYHENSCESLGDASLDLIDYSANAWLEHHERVVKLGQQAILEASQNREETVKELMIIEGKLELLVHSALTVSIWRHKILSKLLEETPNLKVTILIYTVLYHEVVSISFLETLLYHDNSCESLGDASLDLIDYSANACTQLIGLINNGYHETLREELKSAKDVKIEIEPKSELERQMKDMTFHIGMKSITILSYLVDHLERLPLGAVTRLVKIHDTPCILSEILQVRPWMRRAKKGFEKYIDEKWKKVAGDLIMKVVKPEAQTWFCLRQLLFNQDVAKNYQINDFRQRELGKLSGLLNEQILDQIPPLADLKHCLCTLQVRGYNDAHKLNLVLEEVPMIKENIMEKARKIGWKKILKEHKKLFIEIDQNDVIELAKTLNESYNLDFYAEIEKPEENICNVCQKPAEKKCARCHISYYCSVDCQRQDWKSHKKDCTGK
uniref:CSON004625 protein n=1 Tax=Culicoides sonorensis TaxID=179676 RepID=A0A336L5D1_CULSO